jgi:hypothetical protein
MKYLAQIIPYIDSFEYFAICNVNDDGIEYQLLQNKFTKLKEVESKRFKLDEPVKTDIQLFNKDQRIPCILHFTTNRIKEKTIIIHDIDEEELAEELEMRKQKIFGINRLKTSNCYYSILSMSDERFIVKFSLIPKALDGIKLSSPLTLIEAIYNGFSFSKQNACEILDYKHSLFISLRENDEQIYLASIAYQENTQESQYLNYIERLVETMKIDLKIEKQYDIIFYNAAFKTNFAFISNQKLDLSQVYRGLIQSIQIDTNPNDGKKYLKRQRFSKLILAYGLIFLSLFLISEFLSVSFSGLANYYTDKVNELALELQEVKTMQTKLTQSKQEISEIRILQKTRTSKATKIHQIAEFFNNDCWMKEFLYEKNKITIIGFAIKKQDLSLLIGQLNQNNFFAKPIFQKELRYKDLSKDENIYQYKKLIKFQLELSI